jgi:hypothetical protein
MSLDYGASGNTGKPDRKGRSSGERSSKEKRAWGPAILGEGVRWDWVPTELKESPPWRALGPNSARFVGFLGVEHTRQGGKLNDQLQATYDQLVSYGCSRRCISEAIDETVAFGFVRVMRHGGRHGSTNVCALYRLTFLPSYDHPRPTDEWKRITPEFIAEFKASRMVDRGLKRTEADARKAARDAEKSRSAGSPCGTTVVSHGELQQPENGELQQTRAAHVEPLKPAEIQGIQAVSGDLSGSSPCDTALYILEGSDPAGQSSELQTTTPPPADLESGLVIPFKRERHQKKDRAKNSAQIDLEDLLGGPAPQNPMEDLRHQLGAHLEKSPRGEQARIARLLGVTPCALANWKANRDRLNPNAIRILKQILGVAP